MRIHAFSLALPLLMCALPGVTERAAGQTGSASEPVRYGGGAYVNLEGNTSYPLYTRSSDRGPEGFQPLQGNCSSISYYHRKACGPDFQ
jgi:hypothetical protein